jgi:hypothetical protein
VSIWGRSSTAAEVGFEAAVEETYATALRRVVKASMAVSKRRWGSLRMRKLKGFGKSSKFGYVLPLEFLSYLYLPDMLPQ